MSIQQTNKQPDANNSAEHRQGFLIFAVTLGPVLLFAAIAGSVSHTYSFPGVRYWHFAVVAMTVFLAQTNHGNALHKTPMRQTTAWAQASKGLRAFGVIFNVLVIRVVLPAGAAFLLSTGLVGLVILASPGHTLETPVWTQRSVIGGKGCGGSIYFVDPATKQDVFLCSFPQALSGGGWAQVTERVTWLGARMTSINPLDVRKPKSSEGS